MEVLLNNFQKRFSIKGYQKLISRGLKTAARLEGLGPGLEVSVSFMDDAQIQELNLKYRGLNEPTDVLSFPQTEEDGFFLPEKAPRVLGDIVISLERAWEQAADFGHSMEREVVYLAIHGIFHLLGYDHQTPREKGKMRQREEAVLNELGLGRDCE
ncbi:MAG: rRNA maturation RNase YbeY [Firmicutes bacterium]|nr:rRNA maturation RNase YbeY [Bacillota bacterium]